MSKKHFISIPVLLTLSLLVLALAACSAASTKTPETISDPYAYCAAVGQIDTPDARYTGPKMSDALFKDYLTAAKLDANMDYPDQFKEMTVWRCMDHKVWVCHFGANIPCLEKADSSRTPTPETARYCMKHPVADPVPAAVTGRATIYQWGCREGKPEPLRQLLRSDPRGYLADFWYQLPN